jgi:hypothetical protein
MMDISLVEFIASGDLDINRKKDESEQEFRKRVADAYMKKTNDKVPLFAEMITGNKYK